MFDAISPSDPALARMRGKAEIIFRPEGPGRVYQQAPLRVLFPDAPEGEPPQAALVTTSGGLTGGDVLDVSVCVHENARGMVVASAAEKLYRSTGPDTAIALDLTARHAGWLEMLPQETILFEGSRLRRTTRLDLEGSGRILAGEMLVFGRAARGERMTRGLVRDSWEVRQDGRLVWADALHLEGDIRARMDDPAGLNGAVAAATLVLAGENAPAPLLAVVRAALDDYRGRAAAGIVNGLLVSRWLDGDAARLRKSFGAVWTAVRHQAAGLSPRLPRLWEI